ncbi:MAG TPA: hypothetical protein VMW48_15355 [Vicinamibacterales bacterium]|nr:hypothetical protein [Vicinamibacterales bacterium]
MADALKVLGQAAPAATTLSPLYTVPALTQVTASTLVVCNQNAAKIKFRVSVAIAAAADAPAQYLFFDVTVLGNSSFTATLGITLGASDVVRVYSDTANVSFNLFGVEVT